MNDALLLGLLFAGMVPVIVRAAAAKEPWRNRRQSGWREWTAFGIAAGAAWCLLARDPFALTSTDPPLAPIFVSLVATIYLKALADQLEEANEVRVQLAADLEATRAITEAIDRGWAGAQGSDRLARRPDSVARELRAVVTQARKAIALVDGKDARTESFPSLDREAYMRLRTAQELLFHVESDQYRLYLPLDSELFAKAERNVPAPT